VSRTVEEETMQVEELPCCGRNNVDLSNMSCLLSMVVYHCPLLVMIHFFEIFIVSKNRSVM